MKRPRIKIGDCFVIPLLNGKFSYGQFIYYDNRIMGYGYMIKIFNLFSDTIIYYRTLSGVNEYFPPVFVGLKASIHSGRWKIIGNLPISEFIFPKFRLTNGSKPGKYHDWEIWDGSSSIFIGDLPNDLRTLEILCVWGDELLEERIITGDTIHNNLW